MLVKAERPLASDLMTPEEAIKDPFVLEFLNLKDQYSESELEEARYSLEGLPNMVLAAEYRTALPDEKLIAEELARSCRALESRRPVRDAQAR